MVCGQFRVSNVTRQDSVVFLDSPSLPEVKLRYASEQPCLCSLCGMVIRQARNLRRHLLTSCPSRPDVECQIETSEIDFPKIEIPNESQNELLHRQSSPSPEFGLTCEPAVPQSPESESATSDLKSDLSMN